MFFLLYCKDKTALFHNSQPMIWNSEASKCYAAKIPSFFYQ